MAMLAKPGGRGESLGSSGRGIVKPVTRSRDMKCYIVTKSELGTLSSQNGSYTFCVGMSSALLSLAVGFWTSKAFADPATITPVGIILAGPVAWILAAMSLAFAIAATVCFFRSK